MKYFQKIIKIELLDVLLKKCDDGHSCINIMKIISWGRQISTLSIKNKRVQRKYKGEKVKKISGK